MKVGLGFDVHAFAPSRRLVLGGVEIPGHAGLSGHSDADVLCHAIGDALLGAAGLGDLGSNFPSDETWAGASSLEILRVAAERVADKGLAIDGIDATVVAEEPRLGPFQAEMRTTIATALSVDPDNVSIKVTSTDGLGSIGRGEGIASMAVAVLSPLG
ncbi:MAG: 2-C-methyl-D-erythritol 2,4-cyclodiphosphate synthase [Actinomycetota bacterium]|jgi:2-C-methyl-D-erythritol 2,4-cyclodiphosphate synthase|nr:2-C-methyl-D-erythritol 2,4-cyclodiphosphate synthase [Actinomycetota bacterium]